MNDSAQTAFYDGNDYKLDDSIGYLMRQIVATISLITDERMAEHGLTDAQWKPLLMIQQGQCKTAAELSRMACSDAGAVTRMLDRVEAKGLVQRTRSSEDRRVINIGLTEEGSRTAAMVPHVLADVLNSVLTGFSEAEARQLKGMLQRVLANARQLRDGDAASQG
ncbi:MarR family transcriptional regulator [Dechloromonas sp. XY25]|uniref:MarR family transcriptional regulator n=1 Tax=Dechloromonas hankyongensis TaxID=2908002 RepID=A0ABS9K2H3_9RHOO|nr:MarR family transcriptional regulator [Dechloromonas hankyongensis]MCG2577387.1 MarR family transcriptional regulator [Dechloromonas hankyongensis]